ncbi:MAG: hypothetical protein KDD50_12535 [Bdellovibrionales bacterium]|nr:hypothetical protein [Bdellovibrionales bacterium]
MGTMSLERLQEDGKVVIKISGNIDEDSNFTVQGFGSDGEITIDLEDVVSINSCGIREWINWLKDSKQVHLNFRNCPKVIIDQINMVSGFLPDNGKVESFFVPYYSEDSGEEKLILFRHGVDYTDGDVNAPEKIKDQETGDELEIDVVESKYFRFLTGK